MLQPGRYWAEFCRAIDREDLIRRLSRDLADRRIWPSIDITLSGTRREEKILPPEALESMNKLVP